MLGKAGRELGFQDLMHPIENDGDVGGGDSFLFDQVQQVLGDGGHLFVSVGVLTKEWCRSMPSQRT